VKLHGTGFDSFLTVSNDQKLFIKGRFRLQCYLEAMATQDYSSKKQAKERAQRFGYDDSRADEVGTVTNANGKQVGPGQDGFMDALALEFGFKYEEEVKG